MQLGQSTNVRPGVQAVADHVRAHAGTVELLTLRADDPWWFTSPTWVAEEARETTRRMIEVTRDWLDGRFEG